MAQAGGRSQSQEGLREATAILKISRRWKAMYGGLFRKLK
jgi:Rps23 Pro-64 3,4-dihydroxylase Tpa1-like proline 4-hydroxylase